MCVYSADTKNDFLCKIVLKSGSLKSCPRASDVVLETKVLVSRRLEDKK